MCGIVGIIDKSGGNVSKRLIERMTLSIAHRGPTGGDIYIFNQVGLGNRRLAIIDPVCGEQPLCNEDKSIWITYNGEIYNFKTLKFELEAKGHFFKTKTDTEMVVHAYEEWGDKCVEYFRGMFSLAIVDLKKNKLFLARDQLGIKPLYYMNNSSYFSFASEIQPFHCIPSNLLTIDNQAIDQYLWLQYIPAPRTVFKEVKKLPPANRINVYFDGRVDGPEEYWQFSFDPDFSKSEQYWIDYLEETLRESVQAHIMSDVPFGAFLSGGLDSSAVVAFMAQILNEPVKTFTIGFKEDGFNEVDYAQIVSNRWSTDHFIEVVKPDALEILPQLVKHYGEPFGDSSAIPTYYVSRLAQQYVPMVLSGDGGDEGFAGYGTYGLWMRYMTGIGLPRWKNLLYPIASKMLPDRYPPRKPSLRKWYQYINYLNYEQRLSLWRPEYHKDASEYLRFFEEEFQRAKDFPLNSIVQYMDIKTYLPFDILTKVDIASMMHGLEVRTPLVDIKVMELLSKIPYSLNISSSPNGEWKSKLLLKKVLKKYYPDEFIHRPKMGFAIPIKNWFAPGGIYHNTLRERLLDKNSPLQEFFKTTAIDGTINDNLSGPLWLLLFLDEWLRQNKQVVI